MKKNPQRAKGFALVGLLVVFILASLLTAVLAPWIIKQLRPDAFEEEEQETTQVSMNYCKATFSPNCSVCEKDKCLVCLNICPKGQRVDSKCNCKAIKIKKKSSVDCDKFPFMCVIIDFMLPKEN